MAFKPGASIWVPPSAQAKVGAETLTDISLRASDTRRRIDARLDGAIQDGSIESTTEGAPMLTMTILDPDNEMLGSDLFSSRRIDVTVDGIVFRLVQVSRQDDELIELSFEHRLVSYLRAHDAPRKASRATKTRAEFAYSLALEVEATRITFISPDVHKRQPRKEPEPLDQDTKNERRAQGFAQNADLPFSRSQLKVADTLLSVAAGLNAGAKASKALIEAALAESNLSNLNYGDRDSLGVLQVRVSTSGSAAKSRDVAWCAKQFLTVGFWGKGSAIDLAKGNPTQSAGWVAQQTQGSDYPSRYDQRSATADEIIDAWRGEALTASSSEQYYERFEFKRGAVRKGDAEEDSWVALQRLAQEVRWRCFISGQRILYFVSDEQLMRSRPLYLIDPQTAGVQSVTFDMEVGRRTVVTRGRRERKPSEAAIKVRLGRWAAPPGSIVELADYGIADGRWIVDSMTRPLFDADGEVRLRQPQKAFREPAPTLGTRDSSRGGRSGGSGGGNGGGGRLPKTYTGSPVPGQKPHPATHPTGGLPGYPAFDYMGSPGTPVVSPEDGKIRKLSGRDPKEGGPPGGPLGYSIYVAAPGTDYFLTHLDNVRVKVGQSVGQGEQIAEIADGPPSWSVPHCHCGVHQGNV